MDPHNMTYSALVRFACAVDSVMQADGLDARERRDLIAHWAYQYARPDMPAQLAAAIARCQADPDTLLVTATSRISSVTGDVVAYNPR
jgi:hypothetical protein